MLILKAPNPAVPGQHKLLTTGVHLVRLLHKFLGQRTIQVDWGVEMNGCLKNLTMNAILSKSRALDHDLHLAYLDMSIVSDSCHHQTVG